AVIGRIVVTRGPGSYAGLRVGSATAQGLGLALNVPVTGMSTLELVAAASGRDNVTAIHPAGRGDYALQTFENGVPTGEIAVAPGQDIAAVAGIVAGEDAGSFGGIEVGAAERAAAALRTRPESAQSAEPIYLREPHITRPRRPFG